MANAYAEVEIAPIAEQILATWHGDAAGGEDDSTNQRAAVFGRPASSLANASRRRTRPGKPKGPRAACSR